MITNHDLPVSHCLSCGKKLDAASSVTSDTGPEPGDATVCLDCGHLMAFTDDLSLRELTDAEVHELAGSPDLLKNMAFIAAYHRFKKDS